MNSPSETYEFKIEIYQIMQIREPKTQMEKKPYQQQM